MFHMKSRALLILNSCIYFASEYTNGRSWNFERLFLRQFLSFRNFTISWTLCSECIFEILTVLWSLETVYSPRAARGADGIKHIVMHISLVSSVLWLSSPSRRMKHLANSARWGFPLSRLSWPYFCWKVGAKKSAIKIFVFHTFWRVGSAYFN